MRAHALPIRVLILSAPSPTGRCKSCPDGLESPEGSEAITDCVTFLGGCEASSNCETSSVVRLALSQALDSAAFTTVCGRVEIVEAHAPNYVPVNQQWGAVCKLDHLGSTDTWDDQDAKVCGRCPRSYLCPMVNLLEGLNFKAKRVIMKIT